MCAAKRAFKVRRELWRYGRRDVPETASGLVAVNAPVVALAGAEMADLTNGESIVWSDVASSVEFEAGGCCELIAVSG